MSKLNTSVSLYGAVPKVVGDKEIISLTGSATIIKIGGKKFLVDLGLFQGGEGSDLFNKENIAFLKDIDGVIITHSHIDHIGRIPLLHKLGFTGPIYMTSSTKSITMEMLLDSLKIQEGNKMEDLKINKKLGLRLRDALKIRDTILLLNKNSNLDKDTKESSKEFLDKKLGENYNEEYVLSKLDDYLGFYNVKEENDIQLVIKILGEKLFELEDILGVMDLVQTIDYSEEKIISSTILNSRNNNTQDQELLNNLPSRIAEGYEGSLSVNTKSEKRKLKQKWESVLKKEIDNAIEKSGSEFEAEKEKLKKQLESAFTLCEKYSYLKDNEHRRRNEYKYIRKEIKNNQQLLDKYNIKSREDIEHILKDNELLVDLFKIDIPFNSEDIKKASGMVEVNNTSSIERNIIGVTFSDAAHVVGSASVILTSGVVKKKVNNLLDINGNAVTVCFSGDLGRIDDNRLGRPEIPSLPVDYLQIESTYGGRDHLNRKEAVENLINSIEESEGNVLISVFSQQRTQEILLTLLEEKIKRGIDCLDYDIVVDAPLAEKITNIYLRNRGEVFDLLSEKAQIENFGKVVFRFLKMDEWEEVYEIGTLNKAKNFADLNLNDGLLKNLTVEQKGILELQINEIKKLLEKKNKNKEEGDFKSNKEEINLSIELKLDEICDNLGEEIFIQIVNRKVKKKQIILASSGMMDGGAIMNHLPCILEDKDATILAPGYLSQGTLGNDIVMGSNKSITINGDKYNINCNTKFIDGFSSHIGHDEILQYITEMILEGKLKQGSTIALTHGNINGQESLQKDICEILKGFNREDIIVTIPDLYSEYNIGDRNFSSVSQENIIIRDVTKKRTGVVPEFLLGKNKKTSCDDTIEDRRQVSEEEDNLKILNTTSIIKSTERGQSLLKERTNYILNYFSKILDSSGLSFANKILGKLSKLGGWQKKIFYNTVNKKLDRNRALKSQMSSLKNQKLSLQTDTYNAILDIYKILFDFNKNDKQDILKRISDLDALITKYEKELEIIEEEFKEYRKENSIKNNSNSKEFQEYEDKLRNIKNILRENIRRKNAEETIIKSFLYRVRKAFYNIISNERIQAECNKYIESFNNNTLKEVDDIESSLEKTLYKVSSDIDTNLTLMNAELESDLEIYFKAKDKNFGGRNLYKELYEANSSEVDIEILEGLLLGDIFSDEDIQIINKQLEIINSDTLSTKKRKHAQKNLKKYFKLKENENQNLGINASFSIEELSKNYLDILSKIFDKDYFNDYILVQFNIYLFLKSKNTFEEYISNKFDLLKLKGLLYIDKNDNGVLESKDEKLNKYDKVLDELEHQKQILNGLNRLNDDTVGIDALFDVQHLIDLTEKEIDSILDMDSLL